MIMWLKLLSSTDLRKGNIEIHSLYKLFFIFLLYILLYIKYIVILSECIAVFHLCDGHVERPDEEIRSPRTEVIDSCKPPMGAAN